MAYQTSSEGNSFQNKIKNLGKARALVPPAYKPPLEIPIRIVIVCCVIAFPILYYYGYHLYGTLTIVGGLVLFGIKELFIQDDHTIVRIYGPLGRLRYIVEDLMRDKYLQYFNETNTSGRPMPKLVRDYIYQKAHGVKAMTSFGTELDIDDDENTAYTRVLHRNFPGKIDTTTYEVLVGEGREDIKPFKVTNCINISGMSYGALNYKACESMSFGAKEVCFVNTGEGGFGPHGVAGNDVVFQIGTGKFGVGDDVVLPDGSHSRKLNEQLLTDLVKKHDNIKMIQIKISQGAKPGLGGHLPGSKVTPIIAAVRKVEPYKTVISPSRHVEFMAATPKESINKMLDFVARVRTLTQLPVGIKMCVGRLEEIDWLVEAMKAKGDGPDAIQIDGADGGTGAGPNVFVNYVGYGGAVETTAYLDMQLKKHGLRDRVKISASGRVFTPAHAAMAFAYGADYIETARGAMLALGCIQALVCHTGHCPTGITTHNPWRVRGLVIPEKATRVHMFFKGYQQDMMELTHVMGHSDPRDIQPQDVRAVSYKQNFSSYFENDPFGTHIPSPEEMIRKSVES